MNNNNLNPGTLVVMPDKPTVKVNLKKPEAIGMRTDLKFDRATAEQVYPMLKFDDGDTHVVISEVLRPAKKGEEKLAVMHHIGAGVSFVVDHYEFEGHKL